MDKNKKHKMKFILTGLKNAVFYACILILALTVIATLVGLIKHISIMHSIYMSYYYGGAFVLLVSVPQLYRRDRPGKEKKVGISDTLFGFYGWNNAQDINEEDDNYGSLKGEGFWLGIMLFVTGLLMLGIGVIMENIFFK